jgi:hypothetical protein
VSLGLCVVALIASLLHSFPKFGWSTTQFKFTSESLMINLIDISTVFLIMAIACVFGTSDWIGWIVVAWIYIPKVLVPTEMVFISHKLELYMFGMVCQKWPLPGLQNVKSAVTAYWPIVMVWLLTIKAPDQFGRCDNRVPGTTWERFRWYIIECVLCVCLANGLFKCGDPFHITGALSYWTMFAYTFHVFFARLMPDGWGALLMYALVPVFIVIFQRMQKNARRKRDQKGSPRSNDGGDASRNTTIGASYDVEGPTSDVEGNSGLLEGPTN